MIVAHDPGSSGASRFRAAVAKHLAGDPFEPRLPARLTARLRSTTLDDELRVGRDPACSTLLAARAASLTSASSRDCLAEALEGLLHSAAQPARRMRLRPLPAAVLPNGETLRVLAERLRGGEPLYARGLARLDWLLRDGSGPIFRGDAASVAAQLRSAESELAGAAQAVSGPSRRSVARAPLEPSRSVGGSLRLPDGAWMHPRREGS